MGVVIKCDHIWENRQVGDKNMFALPSKSSKDTAIQLRSESDALSSSNTNILFLIPYFNDFHGMRMQQLIFSLTSQFFRIRSHTTYYIYTMIHELWCHYQADYIYELWCHYQADYIYMSYGAITRLTIYMSYGAITRLTIYMSYGAITRLTIYT